MTDHAYGKVVNGHVQHPVIDNLLAYVVAFPHVREQLFGRGGSSASQDAVGVTVVDAHSGAPPEFLGLEPPAQ